MNKNKINAEKVKNNFRPVIFFSSSEDKGVETFNVQ